MRLILRVSLKMDEKASFFLLYKRIHATVGRLRQHGVTACLQRLCLHFIPTRMRKTYLFPHVTSQFMVRHFIKRKYAELFVAQGMAANAVTVEDTRMRGQARQDRRGRIVLRPL